MANINDINNANTIDHTEDTRNTGKIENAENREAIKGSREQIRRLMVAVNQIDILYYSILRKLKIKESTFVLIYALVNGKSYSQKNICDEWGIPKTTLNTTVQECIRKEYITLLKDGHKEKRIVLTDKGKAYAEKILTPIFRAEEYAIAPLLSSRMTEQLELFARRLGSAFDQAKPSPVEKE